MSGLTPQDWREVAQVFEAAADLPPSERAAYLDGRADSPAIRAEVERMLAADLAAASFLEEPPLAYPEPAFSPAPGLDVGPYRLVRLLGAGGMGTVWLAERADGAFAANVAIKFSLAGPVSPTAQRRLVEERRILAQLQHPHISRLLDAGAAGPGIPYFVMEYVDGQPIVDYCGSRQLGRGPRLELFIDVCQAVHFAHQRLIVHRDLKPANIFVDASGRVRLLDFGVAKLLLPDASDAGPAHTAAAFWTPAYSSPEQQRGEPVTTASDVYSLGVVLGELAGANPPADLAAIAARATDAQPDRRYDTARALAEDVHRFLHGRPVEARPPTFAYRMGRFILRNRALSAALLAAVVVTFSALALFAWQWRAARRAELSAQRNLATAHRLATTLIFDYHDELARLPGATGLRARLAADGLHYLQNLASDIARGPSPYSLDLDISAAWQRLADVQGRPWMANRGDHASALESYRQSAGWARRAHDKSDRPEVGSALALTLIRLAQLETRLHAWPDALAHLEEAARVSSDRYLHASGLASRGDILIRSSGADAVRRNQGAASLHRALQVLGDAADARSLRLCAVVHQRLGNYYVGSRDNSRALAHHRTSLRIYDQLLAGRPGDRFLLRDFADQLSMKAEAQARSGDRAGALADADRAIAVLGRLAASDPDNVESRRDLGYAWYARTAAAGCDPSGLRTALSIFEALSKSPASTREDLESLTSLRSRAATCR